MPIYFGYAVAFEEAIRFMGRLITSDDIETDLSYLNGYFKYSETRIVARKIGTDRYVIGYEIENTLTADWKKFENDEEATVLMENLKQQFANAMRVLLADTREISLKDENDTINIVKYPEPYIISS
uniref:Uncharacterized protein n=1 Tax=viral metagenome TaxID=1070528 RepID=A0A6C0BAH1_9ZZZZ